MTDMTEWIRDVDDTIWDGVTAQLACIPPKFAEITHTAERSINQPVAGQLLILTAAALTPPDDDQEALMSAAVAVELLRVHALIRRQLVGTSAETASARWKWDCNTALLASDFVHTKAFEVLGDVGAPASRVMQCYRTFEQGDIRVAESFATETDSSPPPFHNESVFATATTVGAILGNADASQKSALRDAGFALGTLAGSGTEQDNREDASHGPVENKCIRPNGCSDCIKRVRTALATLPATAAHGHLEQFIETTFFSADIDSH